MLTDHQTWIQQIKCEASHERFEILKIFSKLFFCLPSRFGVSEKNSKRHITVFTNDRSGSLGGWCHGVAAAQVYQHYHSQRKMIFCEHLHGCLVKFGDGQKTFLAMEKNFQSPAGENY